MGCSLPSRASPSMVRTSAPSAWAASMQQELMERPLRRTPQPPQSPVPQISLGPRKLWACRASRSVSPGWTFQRTGRPLTVREMSISGMVPLLSMWCQAAGLAQGAERSNPAGVAAILRRGPLVADRRDLLADNLSGVQERLFARGLMEQRLFGAPAVQRNRRNGPQDQAGARDDALLDREGRGGIDQGNIVGGAPDFIESPASSRRNDRRQGNAQFADQFALANTLSGSREEAPEGDHALALETEQNYLSVQGQQRGRGVGGGQG